MWGMLKLDASFSFFFKLELVAFLRGRRSRSLRAERFSVALCGPSSWRGLAAHVSRRSHVTAMKFT